MTPEEQTEQKKVEEKERNHLTSMKATQLAIEFGFIIALPLITMGFLGKWADAKYHTKFFLPIAILVALASSSIWFYRRIKELAKDLKNKK
jgi:undecaprenyl pyrophosphate phosphatase UppP